MGIHAVRHAADQRVLVGLLGEQRHEFANLHARHVGRNRMVERAGVVVARVGFGINVSRCGGPPHIQIWMTDLALAGA